MNWKNTYKERVGIRSNTTKPESNCEATELALELALIQNFILETFPSSRLKKIKCF